MKELVIVGSGGLAREVRLIIDSLNAVNKEWNLLGWISNEPGGTLIDGLPVLGNDDWIIKCSHAINVVIAVGNGKTREALSEEYSKCSHIDFPNIISPNALIGSNNKIGKGCIIAANSIVTTNVEIGNFFVCNLSCTIGHDCRIQDYVTLYPGVHVSGGVRLSNCSSLGTGANIIENINIGENTFIGAGATVVKDIDNCKVAVGVPAKPLIR